jgi:hypothetical protein
MVISLTLRCFPHVYVFSAFWGRWTLDITLQNSSALQIGRNFIQNPAVRKIIWLTQKRLMEISGVLLCLWRQYEVEN